MLVVHMIIEYGMIILIASFLKGVLKTVMKMIMLTIRWTKKACDNEWAYKRVIVKTDCSE